MTTLERIAKSINEQGGVFYLLANVDGYKLFVSKTRYLSGHNYYYNSPVYQIFDGSGRRVYVTQSLYYAYEKLDCLTE